MPDNTNIEMLAVIHGLATTSTETQKALALAIARSSDGIVMIPLEAAVAVQSVLALQNHVVKTLTEQNQEIADRITALVERLEKK